MTFKYFTYNGISLKDKDYIVFDVDDRSSLGAIDSADSQLNFNHASFINGKFQPFTATTYDDQLTMELSIMKNPCTADLVEDGDGYVISETEMRELKRWLNSPTPQKLTVQDDDYAGIYWLGSFNCEDITMAGDKVGLKLTFTCANPFGFQDDVTVTGDVEENGTITIDDKSDELGYIYPRIVLTLKAAGNLKLTNSFDGRMTEIDNCVNGETITITPTLQISTDKVAHNKIADDFNYRFLRISNNYNNKTNIITVSLPCSYTISYKPIAKAVIA